MGFIACPNDGVVYDYDAVPGYSAKLGKSGKFCPGPCSAPLDTAAVENADHNYGTPACTAAVKAAVDGDAKLAQEANEKAGK